MIKVLHLVPRMNTGGIETSTMNIYRNIDRNLIQFDFLCTSNGEGFYDKEIYSLGGKIHHVTPRRKSLLKNRKDIDSFFREHATEYDIFHAHMSAAGILIEVAAAKKYGIKTIIAHSRNSGIPYFHNKLLHKLNKPRLDKYVTDKFAISDIAAKWLFAKTDDVKIVSNARDTKLFIYSYETRNDIRKQYNWEEKFIVGHIGRFAVQKNHSFLIDVFAEIHKKNSSAVLALVGEGKLESQIRSKISSYGLEECVIFLGVGLPIHRILQGFDVMVFPSVYEGFGNVVLEAQAAGLPVIAADTLTKTIDITGLVTFRSLSEQAEIWADKVLQYSEGFTRCDTSAEIKKAGFDNEENIKWLQNFYLTHSKN